MLHVQLASIHVEYLIRTVGQFPVDFNGFVRMFPECKQNVIPEKVAVRITVIKVMVKVINLYCTRMTNLKILPLILLFYTLEKLWSMQN